MRILNSAGSVDVWVESGTFMGRTTDSLSQGGSTVVSIEPSQDLARKAANRFSSYPNVKVVTGLSEIVLEEIVEGLDSNLRQIAFWLDGHYSGGATHLGPVETPIVKELDIIGSHLNHFDEVFVFIDDFRLFVNQGTDYPTTEYLSSWAKKHKMSWSVEHDIFIAHNKSPIAKGD